MDKEKGEESYKLMFRIRINGLRARGIRLVTREWERMDSSVLRHLERVTEEIVKACQTCLNAGEGQRGGEMRSGRSLLRGGQYILLLRGPDHMAFLDSHRCDLIQESSVAFIESQRDH